MHLVDVVCCCVVVMVQADYHQLNPYHNYLHAADVTQAMYCYLREPQVSCPGHGATEETIKNRRGTTQPFDQIQLRKSICTLQF